MLKAVFGAAPVLLTGVVVLVLLAATAVPLIQRNTAAQGRRPWMVLLLLIWADILSRYLLHLLNGTNYPEDRTAMQWIPLFILLAAFLIDRLAVQRSMARWAALLLLAFPLRTAATANLRTTGYWPEQAIPLDAMRQVEALQGRVGPAITIGAYHQMFACWGFRTREYNLRLNAADVAGFPEGGQDVLLIDPRRDRVPGGYELMKREPDGYLELYRKRTMPRLQLVLDTLIRQEASDAEFRELWNPDPAALEGRAYRVQLDLVLHAEPEPWTGDLVVETNGNTDHYERTLVQFIRHPQRSDSLITTRRIPLVEPGTGRIVVYFWNRQRRTGTVNGRMRVYAEAGNGPPIER